MTILKFGDIVTAVASSIVIVLFIEVLLSLAVIPVAGLDWGPAVIAAISYLLTGIIVGYVFATKIWEEKRITALAKIMALTAAFATLFWSATTPSLADWAPAIKETVQKANPTTTYTASQWYTIESLALGQTVAVNLILLLALGFIGLYIGSALKKPTKT